MYIRSLSATLAALLAVGLLPGQVLRVPGQHPTIGAALAAAQSGTTILVAAGTYSERLTWPGVDGIRLIGETGAANTVIDGALGGRVIMFGSGLSRATLLQGFTITNGLLQSSHSDGAGIAIDDCSPTIRHNRLTDNACDSANWNYGGAIFVTGANADPLIAHNEIDNNELRDGSWNYGAGVHVAGSASADIVGNRIRDNKNLTVSSTNTGRGHGAGVYVAGSALIASNLIAGNTNDTSGWNYGGGIRVAASGTAEVFNNTIVQNVVINGYWQYGGGLHVDDDATVILRGNIVTDNTGHGIYRTSSAGAGVLDSDYDCVSNNSAGDYLNTTAGSNSISVDPQFVGATDFHLSASSPCLDAIPSVHLTADVAMDFDGDPRQVDGDLDGGATNGARLDIGADEFTEVRLSIAGQPQIGATFSWSVTAAQVSLQLTAVSFGSGNTFLAPYGNLLLDPAAVVVSLGATPAAMPLTIPADPALRGVTIYGQSLVLPLTSGAGGQFTNRASVTVY